MLLLPLVSISGPASSATPLVQASGVFINMRGDVLTARHAVLHCPSLFVVKNGQVARATVRAVSNDIDVAVLQATLKPMLSATFISTHPLYAHSMAVFSQSYTELQAPENRQDRARLLGNALTVPGQPGTLQMLSSAQPGASGSAVLDNGGLLLGIVAERVAAGNGSTRSTDSNAVVEPMVSPARQGMASIVRAVTADGIKTFLSQVSIPYAQSNTPQISTMQSPASRAATLAVGIICG